EVHVATRGGSPGYTASNAVRIRSIDAWHASGARGSLAGTWMLSATSPFLKPRPSRVVVCSSYQNNGPACGLVHNLYGITSRRPTWYSKPKYRIQSHPFSSTPAWPWLVVYEAMRLPTWDSVSHETSSGMPRCA